MCFPNEFAILSRIIPWMMSSSLIEIKNSHTRYTYINGSVRKLTNCKKNLLD